MKKKKSLTQINSAQSNLWPKEHPTKAQPITR